MKQRRFARKAGAILISAALCLAVALPIAAYAALQTNYDWYRGHEGDASYTIGTAGELKALAKLVNGTADYDNDGVSDTAAVDFAGKTITASGSMRFLGEAIEPIGTPETPFRGSFDGAGCEVDNFVLNIGAADTDLSASNVGVFGYVGEGGSISNLSVGSFSLISIERDASSTEYIENVGMVVGFCAGSVTNCSNAGALTIASAVEQQSADDFVPVRNIGGVVGQCIYDITNCHNSGTVSVAETASPDPDIRHGRLVEHVGGVVGLAGDASRIGTYDNHIFGEADKHGEVRSCSNTALISVDTPMEGELDRFGVKTSAESLAVGGVVGYSQGSVRDCTNGLAKSPFLDSSSYRNTGYIRAGNGAMVGGICGSLRGVVADNMNVAWADDGADGQDPLVVENCTNYGDVYARVTAGGIVGKASSYTTVTSCLNLYKTDGFGNKVESFVVATRWNKPSPAGIVGTSSGEVSYCANFATIASAVWSNETNRTMTTQEGYYAAGVVGMLVYFDDRAPANGGITTPVSEVFSCYNAGDVISGAGMRQRGIVGQNDGYVHDNVLLEGVVDDDKIVYGDEAGDKEASGTVGENRVYSAQELRSEKIGEAVAFMNVNASANGWRDYWVISNGTGLNSGYPALIRQDLWGENAVSLAGAVLELLEDAPYTGGESTPKLKVTLNDTELIENADYRVIAQEGATQPTADRPYSAYVIGLGRYAGRSDATASYGIVAGDFSKCTMTVMAHTFSYEVELPSADDVIVRTPMGTIVDSEEYGFTVVDDNDQEIEPVNVGTYRVVVMPKEGSVLFSGSLEGQFRIKPASFVQEVKFDDTTIEYLGETYPWVDSTEQGESDNPKTSLPYTGVPVKPTVEHVTYNGHELVKGVDYKVIYGNANSDEGDTGSQDENNMGKEGGRTVGCVTVRYVNSTKCNFANYANMFFNIVDEGEKVDFSQVSWKVEGEQISDGEPLEPVDIYLGVQKLTEGVDYTIDYHGTNIDPGTATFTATGMGRFEGEISGSFEITSNILSEVVYEFSGTGSDDDPYEATVIGAVYHGTRDTYSLEIPETVEREGATYCVVAIGEKAFGGQELGDFTGTEANKSKEKLAHVSLPASVRVIGAYGFGSLSDNVKLNLESVDFEDDSQLIEIGNYAFHDCAKLRSLTIPEGVETIGRQAFQGTSLESLRFLTQDPVMPKNVVKGGVQGSFRDCENVVVYGYGTAQAVKNLVEANKTSGSDPWYGGKNFSFIELVALDGVAVDPIADQDYTGSAVKPSVRAMRGETRLVEGEDYELSYHDNVAAGQATALITGIGRWIGTVEVSFTIKPAKMAKVELSVIGNKLFDGQPVSYEPTLTYLERRLVEGRDYTLSYADGEGNSLESAPSQVGSYRLVATGMGSFTGTRYRAFRIVAASVADAKIENIGQKEYTGAPIEPDPNVLIGGTYLTRDVDYVVTYSNNVERGQAQVVVRGIGGYEGQQSATFNIVAASLGDAAVCDVSDVSLESLAGSPVAFDPVVVSNGTLLTVGVDYTLSYAALAEQDDSGDSGDSGNSSGTRLVAAGLDGSLKASALRADEDEPGETIAAPSEPGTYFIMINGKGAYRGNAAVKFRIVEGEVDGKVDLSGAVVRLESDALVYDGTMQKPAVAVSLGDTALAEGTDYVVSYAGNRGPTSADVPATATVHGMGGYTGSNTVTFGIASATITAADIQDVTGARYAGGAPVTPALVVKVNGRSLVEGSDYSVTYGNNVNAGTSAYVLVKGLGGYSTSVSVRKNFTIAKSDLSDAEIAVESREFNGEPVAASPVIQMDGVTLTEKTDYTVSYADAEGNALATAPTQAGSYQVIATGMKNYTGSITAPYTVVPRSLAGARVSAASQTYTGAVLTPEVTVRLDKTILSENDYTVEYFNNRNAGTATVTVTGKGNYTGTATGTFTVNPKDLSSATVSVGSATYTGSALNPVVTVKVGSVKLRSDVDFTLAFANNKNASSVAQVTVTGKGNYTGTKAVTFTISPAQQVLTLKAKAPKLKATKLKKSKKTIAAKKAFKLTGVKTTATYVKAKGSSAKLSINKKTGKITVKKGTKKGAYKIKVKVMAAKSANYLAATKTITVKVKVV